MISIILPFHNAADTLPACLASIRAQTWGNLEILAINDHSNDGSECIVGQYPDARIRLISNRGVGLVDALNHGLATAKYDIVARMDADDLMHPQRLQKQAQYLDQHPDIDLVGCQAQLFPTHKIQAGYRHYINWQNAVTDPDEVSDQIFIEAPFAHPSIMARKTALLNVAGYRYGDFPEDYDLWLRLNHNGARMAKVPEKLLFWRESNARLSRTDQRYARKAFDQLRAEFLVLDQRLQSGRAIAIWGAGRRTRQRVSQILHRGVTPVRWIDIDDKKIGNLIDAVPVVSPLWLKQVANSPNKPFVLIYVTNHGAREEIAAVLDGYGYEPGEDYLAVG